MAKKSNKSGPHKPRGVNDRFDVLGTAIQATLFKGDQPQSTFYSRSSGPSAPNSKEEEVLLR